MAALMSSGGHNRASVQFDDWQPFSTASIRTNADAVRQAAMAAQQRSAGIPPENIMRNHLPA